MHKLFAACDLALQAEPTSAITCRPDGLYEAQQCDTKSCWCVDKQTGDEIDGSKQDRGAPKSLQCEDGL
jgi:hypothetical protein